MCQFQINGAVLLMVRIGICLPLFGVGCADRETATAPSSLNSNPHSTDAARTGARWFTDVTESVGLNFVHRAGPTGELFMPLQVGSGAALIDFDNDGRLDIYLIQNAGPDSLPRNCLYRQSADGTFEDVSTGSGLDIAGYGMGVAVGDVDNDGWPDMVVTEFGKSRLFRNNQGRFADVSENSGLDNPAWGCSVSFLDFDRDGWLDVFMVNYVDFDPDIVCDDRGGRRDFCGPGSYSGSSSRLFRNLGRSADAGPRFLDMTIPSGIGRLQGPGLGVICADFDGDYWTDILVANDGAANHLWINQHDSSFKEEAVIRGLAYNAMGQPQANMGIAFGDVDSDGLDDVFITHLPGELHVCWKQGPRGFFQDRTSEMGLGNPNWRSTGFGTLLADFNQDGAVDLALANGGVRRQDSVHVGGNPEAFWDWYAERNQVFANDGDGGFCDISQDNPDFCGEWGVSRGLACGDLDGDGALDLIVNRIDAPVRVLKNTAPGRGHWLLVRVIDENLGGRDAYGAEVTVTAGDRCWRRLVNPSYSYLSSNDPRVHFGLGDANVVDSIEVIWPDGTPESFAGTTADQLLVIAKGKGLSR